MARPVWGQAYHDGVTSANASLVIRALLVAVILQPTMALAYIDQRFDLYLRSIGMNKLAAWLDRQEESWGDPPEGDEG